MQKNNICLFIQALPAGGAEKQAIMLANQLSEYHNVHLVIYKNEIDKRFEIILSRSSINITILKGNPVIKLYNFYRLLQQRKIEILFSYLLTGNFFGSIIGKLAGVKYRIGGIRNAQLNPKKEILERCIHNYINTNTIFNNYFGAEIYGRKGFSKNKITIIPNGIDVYKFKIHEKKANQKLKIVTVGRFVKQKDFYTAIDSIKYMIDSGYNEIQYQIIGYGKLENQIKERINNLGLNGYITMLINPKNLDDIYKNADIYLCTSIFEGLSNTILEAMSFCLPIVATNVGDNMYLVNNGKNGFLVEPKNLNQISNALLRFINNRDLLKSYGLNSYNKVKNEYSINTFTNNYLTFIKRLPDSR